MREKSKPFPPLGQPDTGPKPTSIAERRHKKVPGTYSYQPTTMTTKPPPSGGSSADTPFPKKNKR